MAKIYTENQISNYAHEVGTEGVKQEAQSLQGYATQFNQKAEDYEKQAKNIYGMALKNEAANTMNDLYTKYSNDPVTLDAEFKKAYNKVSSEIVDDDIKIDFMADVSLKRQSYLTRAYENKRRSDYTRAKSIAYDSIEKNTQMIGDAFSSILGGDYSPDNVAAYGKAIYDTESIINTLNDDGTYMFSDEQRSMKRKAIDNAHYSSLVFDFNSLPAYKKRTYIENLLNDKVSIITGYDKENEGAPIYKNLQDIVSKDSYNKFKEYAFKFAKKKNSLLKNGLVLDEDEAWSIAEQQTTNSILIENEFSNIKAISSKKDKTAKDRVECVIKNLSLQDAIQNFGMDGLSETDYKKYRKQAVIELLDFIKADEDDFDDSIWNETVMSTGLQVMKRDGKINESAWGDDASVAMIRNFYQMAKENNLDLRATDSGSRETAKKIASKAIKNTQERVSGGYGKEFNSVFLNGRKISNSIISDKPYNNPNYTVENGIKTYTETGIEVEL